jgi:hypothetical protein
MIWLESGRIPAGNWPFLNAVRNGLSEIEKELESDIDLTEGNEGITITGCMRAYRHAVLRRALDLAQGAIVAWNSGLLVSAIACARSLLETIATFHSFLKRAESLAAKKEWENTGKLVDAYAFSSSSGAQKAARTEFSPPMIGRIVKEFIAATQPGQERFWDQICDTAYPNGKRMMDYAGTLKDSHYFARPPSESEPSCFAAVFNTLFSCCWLITSEVDFEIHLAVMRSGDALPADHPLIVQRNQLDAATAEAMKNLGPMRIGPLAKREDS